jgi:hypothetical protein
LIDFVEWTTVWYLAGFLVGLVREIIRTRYD